MTLHSHHPSVLPSGSGNPYSTPLFNPSQSPDQGSPKSYGARTSLRSSYNSFQQQQHPAYPPPLPTTAPPSRFSSHFQSVQAEAALWGAADNNKKTNSGSRGEIIEFLRMIRAHTKTLDFWFLVRRHDFYHFLSF